MQIIYLSPEIWLLIGICGIMIYGLFNKDDHFYIMYLSIWILVMTILGCNSVDIGKVIFFFNYNFIISPFIQFLKTIIIILGIIIIYVNYFYWESTNNKFEIYILILLLIWNFLILISINELILLLLFMEIHGIIAYTLTGKRENSSLAKEAMIKFFILGAIAVGFMGFGITIIYLILGSTNLNELSILITDFYGTNILFKNYIFLIIGIVFFIFGFLFKLTLVPFHFWIGDVYQSASLSIILFFATIPVLCYVYLFSKITFFLNIHLILIILLFSIFYGTFMSIYQVKLMRLIGYSAIIHISYALLGIMQGTSFGVKAGIFYIIIYCFLNVGLFLIIIILKNNKLFNELHLIEIVDFLKILNSNFYLSIIITSIFFAMAGIPVLSGFFIKLYIYLSLGVTYNYLILFLLLIIGVVNSVYYIRLIRLNLFNGEKLIDNIIILDLNLILLLILIFIINIFFIFFHIFCIIHIFSLV